MVDGKPTGQTMGIRKIDNHHAVAIVKFHGKEMGISKSELSPDGKVLKVETDYKDSNPTGPEPVSGPEVSTIASCSK